jgi:hypothetical protein
MYMTISAPNARIIALGPLRLRFGSTRLAVMSTSNSLVTHLGAQKHRISSGTASELVQSGYRTLL